MKLKSVLPVILLMLFAFGCKQPSNEVVFHKSHEPNKQQVPYSDMVESNGLSFLSGQIGMDHNTRKLVEGGIEAETKKVYRKI